MIAVNMLRGLLIHSKILLKRSQLYEPQHFFHTCNGLAARVAFNLSDIGEGIREVVVKEWYVKEGDKVAQFDNICEVQSDKASVTITSRYDGVISKLHYNIDDVALVGKPLIDIEVDDGTVAAEHESPKTTEEDHQIEEVLDIVSKKEEAAQPVKSEHVSTVEILCIPSVRRLAKEYKIDLKKIKATGKGGRITKEDVLKYLDDSLVQKAGESAVGQRVVQLKDEVKPVTGFQKTMVRTMTEAMKIPHFVYHDEMKVTNLSDLRKILKTMPELNLKLSFIPFFVKAISNALRHYPIINTSLDERCENIIYHKNHNIGIAMDTALGLAVPVIKEVENKSIIEISSELNRLMKSGKNGSFAPNDLSGGTISFSNIGSIGGTYAHPVILPPQVAIIAIGASQTVPRFDDVKNVIAEEVINVSASGDHRIIDGASMARFINMVKKQIESPYLLLLNVH